MKHKPASTQDQIDQTEINTFQTVDELFEEVFRGKISRASLFAAVKRGEIPHVRIGRRILIPRHAFRRWLDTGSKVA